MRGEHVDGGAHARLDLGSSPHARGALFTLFYFAAAGGIIPACAGSTRMCLETWALKRDHPRMRGEHNFLTKWLGPAGGSSPHARGARICAYMHLYNFRIIPACAGSTHR